MLHSGPRVVSTLIAGVGGWHVVLSAKWAFIYPGPVPLNRGCIVARCNGREHNKRTHICRACAAMHVHADMCPHACARVCVCACVRARVCGCMEACWPNTGAEIINRNEYETRNCIGDLWLPGGDATRFWGPPGLERVCKCAPRLIGGPPAPPSMATYGLLVSADVIPNDRIVRVCVCVCVCVRACVRVRKHGSLWAKHRCRNHKQKPI